MDILHISNITFKGGGVNTVLPQEISFENKLNNINSELIITSDIKEPPQDIDFNCYILDQHNIKNLLTKLKPDFIIFHLFYIFKYIKLYKIIKKLGIPYLIKPHGGFSKIAQRKSFIKKKIANLIFYKKFVKDSEGIIFLTEDELKNSIFKKNNNYIIPNGVNNISDKFNFKNKNNNRKKTDILFLGRIDINHKGIDYLLEAIKIVKNRLLEEDICINIYGFGENKDIKYLKKNIKQINKNRKIVKFYGSVFGEEKLRVFLNSDIFILTSRYEGMPMGIIEALSYGLPCIVTKGTNMTKFIENNNCGWITKLNSNHIGNQIVNSTQEFKLNKESLIRNARNASIKFKWDNNINRYKSEYNKIYNNIY